MTPLIKVSDRIYAKLETYQPTGSVKDRLISYLVEDALIKEDIIAGKTKLVEATSGNTGIALASAAAKLGCECVIIMPRNMSEQRKQMMKAFGATIIEVGDNDFQSAIKERDKILKNCSSAWAPMQFENLLNIECHYETTAQEIYMQTLQEKLKWCAYVHGAGTGGTMMGVKKYIDFKKIDVECILTVPEEPASEHGIQGINDGADFLLDKRLMNHIVKVKTSDAIS